VPRRLAAHAALVAVLLFVTAPDAAAGEEPPAEVTQCHDGSLPRQRTEIDADIDVAGFDAALGTLLEVQVPTQSIHLDTDAVFENTAQSAVVFEEHMSYQVTFASPGGLASPPPIAGTIERVPSQTLAAFDGTLDFHGPSAVAQPSATRDAAADPVSSTDPAVLAAFTAGSVAFRVASSIGETFVGGGGNMEARINTFAAASVRVCYRYAPPLPPPTAPTTTPTTRPTVPVRVAAASVPPPRVLAFTGSADAWLAVTGGVVLGVGAALVLAARRQRSGSVSGVFDVDGVDA
jgi:hypothetical protein